MAEEKVPTIWTSSVKDTGSWVWGSLLLVHPILLVFGTNSHPRKAILPLGKSLVSQCPIYIGEASGLALLSNSKPSHLYRMPSDFKSTYCINTWMLLLYLIFTTLWGISPDFNLIALSSTPSFNNRCIGPMLFLQRSVLWSYYLFHHKLTTMRCV